MLRIKKKLMTKRISINILAISFIGILLVPITGSAHRDGGQNPPEKVHKVIEVLYGLDPEDVHDKVTHNFNNYGNRPHNNPDLCDGYEGGHSGYDFVHKDDDAPFYSLTDGEVINVKHPTNNIKDLSYISIYTSKKTVFYLHPSYIDVRIGQRVEVGDYLGKQGNTGNSTNPHVHLEVRKGRSKPPSCGIAAAKRTDRPNEDPIFSLYDHVKDFNRGGDNNRSDLEKVHKVIEVLYGLDPEDVHDEVAYDFNNYGNRPHNNPDLCDGYEGGHSGYDVAHEDDDAPFYSLTGGEVINVKHPTNDIRDLSYISIYNATHNKTVLYLHPSYIDVRIGQRVEVGDYLGKQGNTGNSTNPHVHLEVRKGRSKSPSCGIAAAKRVGRPNEDPIPFLYGLLPEEGNGNGPTNEDSVVSIEPKSIVSPDIGQKLEFNLEIEDGVDVFGYQATIVFDKTALRYLKSKSKAGDYLSGSPFFDQEVEGNTVTLISTAYVRQSKGDGTLATLVFEVIAVKESTLKITDVRLSNIKGQGFTPRVEHAEITEPEKTKEDVNGDGNINILDLVFVASNFGKTGENDADINNDGFVNIQDLVLVAAKLGSTNAAPTLYSNLQGVFTASDVQHWLSQARQLSLIDTRTRKGIHFLEQLLIALTPKQTLLLPNYPNPFNPETWIPYQLATAADVSIDIYAADGKLVRSLDLGHQPIGIYENKSRAAYWDGRNTLGEPVASGVYFYTLTAGDFTATRKMLIRK